MADSGITDLRCELRLPALYGLCIDTTKALVCPCLLDVDAIGALWSVCARLLDWYRNGCSSEPGGVSPPYLSFSWWRPTLETPFVCRVYPRRP
jgi:hypothetical protein